MCVTCKDKTNYDKFSFPLRLCLATEAEKENINGKIYTKKSLINAYRELTDSPAGLVSWYLTRSFVDRSDSPEEVAQKILSVTKEELIASASRLSVDTVYFLKGTLSAEDADDADEDDE